MFYLSKDELRRLFEVAYRRNRRYHLALLVMLHHGMRVSELTELRGTDFTPDGKIIVRRLKGSNTTVQPIVQSADPVFDEGPILTLARERGALRLFEVSRRHIHRLMQEYGREAGVHADKCHPHALKHSTAMLVWDRTKALGDVQSYLGHRAASSTLIYLYEANGQKAATAYAANF
jgi:integrase/recombinase XerD